jgi:hypothetical protein
LQPLSVRVEPRGDVPGQHSDLKQTQRYLNITDQELLKAMTGVWEKRKLLRAVNG